MLWTRFLQAKLRNNVSLGIYELKGSAILVQAVEVLSLQGFPLVRYEDVGI
jgi:hypothetical protein